jgi:thiamine-monophosphate kinase
MDTSDGFAPTMEELARVNGVEIEVDGGNLRLCTAFENADPRHWFGWGDWTVVAAVDARDLDRFTREMKSLNAPWTRVGKCVAGTSQVILVDGDRRIRSQRLESERFASDSWFSEGINGYINRLENFHLP